MGQEKKSGVIIHEEGWHHQGREKVGGGLNAFPRGTNGQEKFCVEKKKGNGLSPRDGMGDPRQIRETPQFEQKGMEGHTIIPDKKG